MKKKIFEKKWIWIIATVIFLVIVQFLFSIPAPCKWLDAVWEAGDLLSLAGTLVLGYVAINQSQKANDMSERLMDIESNRYMMEIRPFVMITDWKAYELDNEKIFFNPDKLYIQIGQREDNEPALGIGLMVQNTTDSFLTVEYSDGVSKSMKWGNSATNQPNRKLRLLAGDSKEIVFYANKEFMKGLSADFIKVGLILENRFAQRYKEYFNLYVMALSDSCIHKDGEWYCDIAVQNFEVGKFDKNSSGKMKLRMEEQTNG